jgi:hypothetical protein
LWMMPFMSSCALLARPCEYCGSTNIKTVELGDAVLRDQLRDARIALRHPPKELWDTHGCDWSLAIAWWRVVRRRWSRGGVFGSQKLEGGRRRRC